MVDRAPGGTRFGRIMLCCALLAVPRVAAADPSPADRAAAEILFDEAVKMLETGNGSAACPKLEESQRLDPGVGTLLYLAECYRSVGRTASAWATFRDASYAADAAGQQDRVQIANAEADKLKASLSYISLVLGDKQTPGLEIKRDGEVVNRALWDSPIPVDPGEHQLEASAPGKLPWTKSVSIAPQPGTSAITIPALADAPAVTAAPAPAAAPQAPPPAATPSAPATPDASARHNSQKTWGWVALGAGAVGLTAGGVFGLMASKDNKAANDECRPDDPTQCNDQGVQLSERAASRAMLSSIAFGVGLAAATTGIVLVLTAPEAPTSARGSGLWLNASAAPTSASINLTGAW